MSTFKKYLPFILLGIVVTAAILLAINGGTGSRAKKAVLNQTLSFYREDKIPYGQYVAYNELKHVFPGASVAVNRKKPGEWDSLSSYDEDQALVIISPRFQADRYEMKTLINFVENGNDVFISTIDIPYEIAQMINCEVSSPMRYIEMFGGGLDSDTLTVFLSNPPFSEGSSYTYPGRQFDAQFTRVDTNIATVLGRNSMGIANFIHLKAGNGNLYVHLAPMAFSNYFLMHKKNLSHYEKVMSLLSPRTRKIVWDEYYRSKRPERDDPERKKNWLGTLLNLEVNTDDDTGNPKSGATAGQQQGGNWVKPFKVAFWLLIIMLVLYVLNEMRRKQRFIPEHKRPRNDSLDFVKTIGRLYHDRGDHGNLCRKMAAYFLDHVRSRYKLPTNELGENFIMTLHNKSGVAQEEIRKIVEFIKNLEYSYAMNISAKNLVEFQSRLESFYNKE